MRISLKAVRLVQTAFFARISSGHHSNCSFKLTITTIISSAVFK